MRIGLVSRVLLAATLCFSALGWVRGQNTGLPPGQAPWVLRVWYPDAETLRELGPRFAPWEVNREDGYLVVELDEAAYRELADRGFRMELDEAKTKTLHVPRTRLPEQLMGIPNYPCYRTVEETYASAQLLVDNHPGFASLIDIGDSWEKTQNILNGYDILVLKLTNAAVAGPKPILMLEGALHAREYTTAELVLRFAEFLIDNYETDADVHWLLDYHEIHIILHANPDGRKQAETGISWRKNANNSYCSNSNSRGSDLNRNFDFLWSCCGGSSGSQCDPTYRGTSAASEPETQAIQNYMLSQFPDQRPSDITLPAPSDATGIFIDVHSYSELVLWPWGHTSSPAPNGPALRTFGRKLAYFNDYRPQQSNELYATDGTSDDFAYGELGVVGFTFELGTAFFQNCATFESAILPDNLNALLYAAKVARTPYLTPAGPDVHDIQLAQAAVEPGDMLMVEAMTTDERFNQSNGAEPTQNLMAARAFVNTPPWEAGAVAIPLTAQDGSFDSGNETVEGDLATTGLAEGRHILFLQAQDSDGNWGAVSAAFFYLLDPETAPRIEGTLRDAANLQPVEGTVQALAFQTTSDAGSGFYSLLLPPGTYDLLFQADGYAPQTVTGVVAQSQMVEVLDVDLIPLCSVFEDDVEQGNQGWTATGSWAITNESAHSATHSWTDSPGGSYGNNTNASITSPPMDFTGIDSVSLSFWHQFNLESGYDYGRVEFSTNGGATWTEAAIYDGNSPAWSEVSLPIPDLDGAADARIRFRLTSDSSVTRDGWHIDDILVTGSSLNCGAALTLIGMLPEWPGLYNVRDLINRVNL